MTALSGASKPRLAAKVRLRWDRHAQQHLLLYPERGLALNASAAAILELCDGNATVDEIARRLAERAGSAVDVIAADVLAFVEAMRQRGLVAVGDV
jgi:coenzyme PQQ biosynthesis protein PqqD